MISGYEFQFSVLFHGITKIAVTAAAVLTFSQFVVQLFGQTVPNFFWPYLKEIGFAIIIIGACIFAVSWFLKAKPHNKPKNYSIVSFDVFGNENKIDGIRTEFKNHDVAWSFMKQYKKCYPLNNFALVSEIKKDQKKVIYRYI
jgi:hypothetical protein